MYGGGGERGGDERNEEEEEALFGGVRNFRILVRTWVNICYSILSSFLYFDRNHQNNYIFFIGYCGEAAGGGAGQ